MAFRADEAAESGDQEMEKYLVPRNLGGSDSVRARSKDALRDIVLEIGKVITAYPVWHPLVRVLEPDHHRHVASLPDYSCGYRGLDHTRYFVNGFITCPYGDGQEVLDSVAALPFHSAARITAKKLDFPLYSDNATPILVRCQWENLGQLHEQIPLSLVGPLLLQYVLLRLDSAGVAEPWEAMRSEFLGEPHGARSSLFVDEKTGLGIKQLWKECINTGMLGPIHV
jgi:hypothetical protein